MICELFLFLPTHTPNALKHDITVCIRMSPDALNASHRAFNSVWWRV